MQTYMCNIDIFAGLMPISERKPDFSRILTTAGDSSRGLFRTLYSKADNQA